MIKRTFVLLMLTLASLDGDRSHAGTTPQGSAFTYQGVLKQGGAPANGTFHLRFQLWDAASGGNQVGFDVDFPLHGIVDGQLSVDLNFGPASQTFNGDARWLEVQVITDGGSTITPLQPRQQLRATPYALYALSSGAGGGGGPWAVNGNNIHTTNSGNVGIGTTNPLNALDIHASIPHINFQDTDSDFNQVGYLTFRNNIGAPTGWMGFNSPQSPNLSIVNTRSDGDIILNPVLGNVGIGTSVPAVLLHASGVGPVMVLQDEASVANQAGYLGFWNSAGTETGWVGYGTPGSPNMSIVNVRSGGDINFITGLQGNVIIQDPFVGLGTSDPQFKLHVVRADINATGYFDNTSVNGDGLRGHALAGAGLYGIADNETGAGVGVRGRSDSPSGFDFLANGAGTNYGATSSRRWKRNIEAIADPLHMLAQLRGVYYDWDAEHGGHHDLGMIAEEVGAVLPEIVNYEENGIDAIGMDYSKLTPLLVEAVKALRMEKDSEIETQLKLIKELEQGNEQLRARIEALERGLNTMLKGVQQ